MTSTTLIGIIVCTIVALLPRTLGLEFKLPVGGKECFYIEKDVYHRGISFNFDILDGETEKIQVILSGPIPFDDPPSETTEYPILYREIGSEGRFAVQITDGSYGLYRACFSNSVRGAAGGTTSHVGFAFHAQDPTSDVLSNADSTKIAHAQKVTSLVFDLTVGLETVKDTLGYMKMRVMTHEKTASSTNSRVAWWTLGESLTLVALALWQISYLRRTFEVRRFV